MTGVVSPSTRRPYPRTSPRLPLIGLDSAEAVATYTLARATRQTWQIHVRG